MSEKIVVRIFQDIVRMNDDDRLFKSEVVGTFKNEFDADFFIEQAVKENLYSWSEICNEYYFKLDTYPSKKGGEINAEHK